MVWPMGPHTHPHHAPSHGHDEHASQFLDATVLFVFAQKYLLLISPILLLGEFVKDLQKNVH